MPDFEEIDFTPQDEEILIPEPEDEEPEEDKLKVIYIVRVGEDTEGNNIFHFLCSKDIDTVWNEEWGEKPACNCKYLQPDEMFYDTVLELKSNIDFILGQESCCCSYQDVCDGCIAMAYENIDGYEEYPPFRLIFKYGETVEHIEAELEKRELRIHYI